MKNFIITITLIMLFVGVGLTQSETRPRIVSKVEKTASSAPTGYKKFVATAYSLRGRTASGEYVREGIIAADPRVLPLGTKVHIHGLGTFVVKDTGGAIKGSRIDIWIPSRKNALQFGKRAVYLKVVK